MQQVFNPLHSLGSLFIQTKGHAKAKKTYCFVSLVSFFCESDYIAYFTF